MEAGRALPAPAQATAHSAHNAPTAHIAPKPSTSKPTVNSPRKGNARPSLSGSTGQNDLKSNAKPAQSTSTGQNAPKNNAQSTSSGQNAPKASTAGPNAPKSNTQPAQSTSSTPSAQNVQSTSAASNAAENNSPRRQGQNDNGNNNKQRANLVHVSGFPPYTQAVDLGRTFSKFGNVRVKNLNARMSFAVLAFTTDAEAKEAIEANKKVNIYGEFLKVRAYTVNTPVPKRDFTRTKQKGVIVEPTEIDLSGDFHQQVDSVLAAVRLTQEEALAVSVLYADLERVLQALWPGCVAMPFGSITTGLGIKTSDADCYLHVPSSQHPEKHHFVNKAKRVLLNYPLLFTEVLAIPRANTPIVKFFHIPTETNCDLSFKTPLGAQNSKLIAFLLHEDPRLIPMAVIIKYWAKVHGLSGTGKLTNYALTMMIIFYLQQAPMSILPAVEWLQRDPEDEVIVDYWNTGFMNKRELMPPCSNTSSIAELLGGFFEYYAKFDFDNFVVCPFLGAPVKKESFIDLTQIPEEFQRYRANTLARLTPPLRASTSMCVQDPFEQCHNVASAISSRLASDIKSYLKFAANSYEKHKLSECRGFLHNILLEKPKIIRSKLHPEFRINLFQRVIGPLTRPDWKNVIRYAVFTVFETMLKIELGKPEKIPNSKKEKVRYHPTIKKAIWKRKQFTRLYSLVNKNFVEKQTRITEEILAIEQETFNLQFSLTLNFNQDPKNDAKTAIVTIKLVNGDVDQFKEFGRFFLTVVLSWLMTLIKGESANNANKAPDTREEIKEIINQIDKNNTLDSDDDDDDEQENVISVDNNDVSSSDDEQAVGNDSGDNKGADETNETSENTKPEQMRVDDACVELKSPNNINPPKKTADKTSLVEIAADIKTHVDTTSAQKTSDNATSIESTSVQSPDISQLTLCDQQTHTQTNS